MPGNGHSFVLVTTAAKKGIVAIFDYKNTRLEEINVTVSIRSESGDLYSFVLDLSPEEYGAKKLVMDEAANA